MAYPVSLRLEPLVENRNRLTTAFRLILAIPHLILFAGTHIAGIREFTAFYLRWRARALAYVMLLEDAYPPFGDAEYPPSIGIVDPAGPRDRLTVGFRIILAIPHFIVL